MQNSNPNLLVSRVPGTWGSLLVLVGFMLIGMAVGNVLAVMVLAIYLGADTESVTALLTQLFAEPEKIPNGWNALMIMQGTVHFFSYLLPTVIYWFYIERRTIGEFSTGRKPAWHIWALAVVVVLAFIPVNSKFIEWNAAMDLPDALSGLEKWMRDKEDQLSVMTEFLTSYQSFGQLLIALFVVTLLPALGEEILFRGVVQTKLFQELRNIHVAIWLSAAIFSAIHFQFYGFLPRMMLGALFGYLYYWTGNLWVAVLAHFVNNGFVLVMMYLHNIGLVTINIEEARSMPVMLILASLLVSAAILGAIRKDGRGAARSVPRKV
ncbi:CPBP family intramembrane glutamic endopeptidase [Dyadobacter fermentans]|uniref:Abortive infection protein n=1 Tax=Dyadobacter fermentans (strain ATCC 700827 / DSM 18053 / CIP 107007 / KCTC 52180 / NS114) TaxID=471854 RepID=C6W5J2_DYAFD|nr:CPBP family intramembrane glutamic endopeptidase [Dyadobacter fermentans]ACT94210.1 Abortive infection protein [Dyadobacter fermentans DSM 18053]